MPEEVRLDLRGTPCPLNYVRCRLALERLAPGDRLLVELDAGEPEVMVSEGLARDGHRIEPVASSDPAAAAVRLRIIRA